MHVAVVGGGVVGVCTAYYLARDGHEVTIVEGRPEVGSDASGGNAGFIAPNDSFSWASPSAPLQLVRSLLGEPTGLRVRLRADPRLYLWGLRFLRECTPKRAHRSSAVQIRLSKYSQEVQQEIEREEEGLDFSLTRKGAFYLYRDPRRLEKASQRSALFQEYGVEQKVLSADEIVAMEPAIGPARHLFAGGIYGASDGSGDCAAFTEQLTERCQRRHGVKVLLGTRVQGFVTRGQSVTGIRAAGGSVVTADRYVLAGGVGSPELARTIGVRLPIYPVKGYSATFNIINPFKAPAMPAVEQSTLVAWSRMGSRLRMSSTAEVTGYDRTWRGSDFVGIERLAAELFPEGIDLHGGSYRACLRPMTPDGPPLIGWGPHRNLLYNTGHGHLGWTMACGSGRIAADLLAGHEPAIDMSGLRFRQ